MDQYKNIKENLKTSEIKISINEIFHFLTEMVEIYAIIKSEENLKENFPEKFCEKETEKENNHTNNTNPNESNEISLQKNYESLIRKLESDLRNHLKVNFI